MALTALVTLLATSLPATAGSRGLSAHTVPSAADASGVVLAPVPGAGAERPRILYSPGTEADLRDRLAREPYRTLFVRSHDQARSAWNAATLGDLTINNQRLLLRAAVIRSFEYALDRTVVDGQVVAFPTPADRQAVGDDARDVLLQILDRSRLAVPPPIGGWDRDITTSEEIVAASMAYDTLLGAGYTFSEADQAEIVRRIAAVTRELWLNFVQPDTASGYADLHQNNHRTKTGTALAIAAVALADEVDDARAWFDTGADYVDDVLRHMLVTGDGAYAEGPFYVRYTTQNLAPYLAVWDRFLGASSWTTEAGLVIPSLAHHPLLERNLRWMLDTSVPDGTMAPIDDGNPGRSHFYGVLPPWLGATASGYWQWARTPQPYDVDGNLALGPLAITTYDDTIAPTAPDWEPSQVYVEGGTATMRSGWGAHDVMALVLGEHDTASEFGRDRLGVGRFPQSHEHAEPGAFLFHAYGERLALDPGYLRFPVRTTVNKPEHHNTVLVDGAGPADYLAASFAWGDDPMGRPPAEGQSTLAHWVASGAGDAVSVVSAYRGAHLDRRVLFGGDRYLVVADVVTAPDANELTWMLHGNGGGTSGGSYERLAAGGRWTIGGARLDSAISVAGATPVLTERENVHEVPYTVERTHTALAATAATPGDATSAVQVLYPTRAGEAAPSVVRLDLGGHAAVAVDDPAAGRRVTVVHRGTGPDALVADGVATDGTLLAVERTTDGTLVSAWADDATSVTDAGTPLLASAVAGTLAVRIDGDHRHVVAPTGSGGVTLAGVAAPGSDASLDGACGIEQTEASTRVEMNRTTTASLLGGGAAGRRPAADAGPDRRVAVGTSLVLDGRASCHPEGAGLTPNWELVSAPAGSTWSLTGTTGWSPVLTADRPGPFRVRLTVRDAIGRTSVPEEVLVKVGPQCADGIDDDLDGLIDTDDPDCDGPPSPPPVPDPQPDPGPVPPVRPPDPTPTTTPNPTTSTTTPGPPPTAPDPTPPLTDAERLVTSLFRDVLGRRPDAAGLRWWSRLLEGGASRSDVVARFRAVPEVNERIARTLIDRYLGRPPTADELTLWSGFLGGPGTVEAVVVLLLGSPEYLDRSGGTTRGFVELAHHDVLGRAPDADEMLDGSALVGSAGRVALAQALLGSGEARDSRVGRLYRALLDRAPDATGAAHWSARLAAGATITDLIFAMAATDEYAGRTPRSAGPDVLATALATPTGP